jgi:hypothetical protein
LHQVEKCDLATNLPGANLHQVERVGISSQVIPTEMFPQGGLDEELILPLNMKSENEVYPMKMKLGDRKGNTTEI